MGVSKKAAAKTTTSLERAGYVTRMPHPDDGRAWVLIRTVRGTELLDLSADIFAELRKRWVDEIGSEQVDGLEAGLAILTSSTPYQGLLDMPGWVS